MDSNSLVMLMIENEQPESLSTRKLVVEAAKHNVLTAYTAEDGLRLLERFPAVDAILVHSGLLPDEDFMAEIKRRSSSKPLIVASPHPGEHFANADYVVSSYEPQALVSLLEDIFPRARADRARTRLFEMKKPEY